MDDPFMHMGPQKRRSAWNFISFHLKWWWCFEPSIMHTKEGRSNRGGGTC